MDSVFDRVGGDNVRVVPSQVIFAVVEGDLNIGLQLNDVVMCSFSSDVQNLHRVLPIACPHKLYILLNRQIGCDIATSDTDVMVKCLTD